MVNLNADSVNTFFSLLRSGMYGVPVPEAELPVRIDWKAVIALARQHAVLGLIIEAVQFLPARLRPDAPTLARMQKFALGLIQTNMVLDRTVGRLVEFLGANGISGVLLKGQGVARYYPSPQARQTGDVDFYVGPAHYHRAVELCRSRLADLQADPEEVDIHFSFEMDGVEVELHRLATRMFTPWRRRRFQRWIEQELEQSPARRPLLLGGTEVMLPSCDFDAIFIFYHAWLHYVTGGIGLRQLCDWAVIFHSHAAEIDRPRLEANLRRFGLVGSWRLFACIAVEQLGVAADRMPLYDPACSRRAEKVLAEIVAGGNFGTHSRAYARMHSHPYGLTYGLAKLRNLTGSFFSLLPIAPAEATFLYFSRLFSGTRFFARTSIRKHSHR